jgi:tRNA uridine 5-carbamoylmethylation protein Kti12
MKATSIEALPNQVGLLLISGAPGLGKSTLADSLSHLINENGQARCLLFTRALVISYDYLMDRHMESEMIKNNSGASGQWKACRSYIKHLVERFIVFLRSTNDQEQLSAYLSADDESYADELQGVSEQFKQAIRSNFTVSIKKQEILNIKDQSVLLIIDDIFYYESMRHIYFHLAMNMPLCSYACLSLETKNIAYLQERNAFRPNEQRVDTTVVEHIWQRYDSPLKVDWEHAYSFKVPVEGPEDLTSFCSEESLSRFFDALKDMAHQFTTIKNATTETAKKQQPEPNNMLHECDLLLRRLISASLREQQLQNVTKEKLELMAKTLNENKNKIMQELRHCETAKQETHKKGDAFMIATLYASVNECFDKSKTDSLVSLEEDFKRFLISSL